MDQKTPSFGKQLSSSLRERLKKCGRYHASPKSSSPGMASRSAKDHIKDKFISPLSRKRYSTTPLKAENPKKVQCESRLSEQGMNNCTETKLGTEVGVRNEFIGEEVDTLSHQPVGDCKRTPVTSKSRLKHTQMKCSRLDFQTKHESHDIVHNQTSYFSSGERHGQEGQNVLLSGSCNKAEKKSTDMITVKDKKDFVENSDNIIKGSVKILGAKTKHDLLKEITIKEETHRKLRMVKTYRTKNNLRELQLLIDKWRNVSQQALQDLHSEMPEPKPTLTQLINHLGIEHDLIDFDPEEETFNS